MVHFTSSSSPPFHLLTFYSLPSPQVPHPSLHHLPLLSHIHHLQLLFSETKSPIYTIKMRNPYIIVRSKTCMACPTIGKQVCELFSLAVLFCKGCSTDLERAIFISFYNVEWQDLIACMYFWRYLNNIGYRRSGYEV